MKKIDTLLDFIMYFLGALGLIYVLIVIFGGGGV